MTEDERVGWHHRLKGHELEQALGDSEGQGNLVCCSPWGRKESDTTERLNSINIISRLTLMKFLPLKCFTRGKVLSLYKSRRISLKKKSLFITGLGTFPKLS